jgi:hypothetical protein
MAWCSVKAQVLYLNNNNNNNNNNNLYLQLQAVKCSASASYEFARESSHSTRPHGSVELSFSITAADSSFMLNVL